MTAHKSENPAATGFLATNQNTNAAKFTSKSTATEAQRHRILNALRAGPKTSYELRRIGCYQSAARVKELRDRFGHNITTYRVNLVDGDGYWHRGCALYTLIDAGGTSCE